MQRRVLVYAIVIAASVAAIAGLLHLGETLVPGLERGDRRATPRGAPPHDGRRLAPPARTPHHPAARHHPRDADGRPASPRSLGQPAVIGEIAAGLLLGPSLVGQFWPAAYAFLFPEASLDILRLLSQVGVILFMFSVGLDVDVAHLRQRAPTAIAVSHFSIVVPFLLGVGAALALYPPLCPGGRAVPLVRALHGHRAQHHGVSGARARHRGARPDADAARHDGPRLRRRRRCDGVGRCWRWSSRW